MDSPLSKKQKVRNLQDDGLSDEEESMDVTRASRSRTPRKLVLGSPEKRFAISQPVTSSSSNVPLLQPLKSELSSSRSRVYSQSPPRSPNRSPTRKLELIQLSPAKKSRLEAQLQELQRGDNSVKRLCIKSLVLRNFKSYAGTQIVGPFDSSFSAIVGPNGSGKSNVIDSLLFVFGFRANKMRQGRLSDLIHKSEAFPNLDFCQVDVHFQYVQDESDGRTTTKLDESELVISRKALKNNVSKYYINNKESTFTAVTQLLQKEGIDLDHKRFLILQGEVESIAQMKAKAEKEGDDGLLEYLESIIGTAKYKPLIEQTLIEMERLNEICQEKENRFEIVEREKSSLESGKDEALEFLEKERQLTILQNQLLQYKLWQNGTKLLNTKNKISSLNSKLDRERDIYAEYQKQIEKLETEIQAQNQKLKQDRDQENEKLLQKRDFDRDRIAAEENLKNLNQKKLRFEKSQETTRKSVEKTKARLSEMLADQGRYSEELLDYNSSLAEQKKKLDGLKLELRGKTSSISEKIQILEKELEPWNLQLQAKRSKIKLEETTVSVLKESHLKVRQGIIDTEEGIARTHEKATNFRKVVDSLILEKKQVNQQLTVGESECNSASLKIKEMRTVLNAHRQRSVDARSSLSNFENKNKVLAALLRLQKSGRIQGFHGRLGDLGTIDDKYDVAISTACPRLDDIVVDSVECGQQCIEYLRKNKLGYARFILLDKLRTHNALPVGAPRNVPRLFDLVKPNHERFKSAFYTVLRDTLVARDLTEANRVAYGKQRFRVVTLDGKLIDLSGAMTGGGNHKASGMMKSERHNTMGTFTAEEVQQIERELLERENNFQIASETLHEMETTLQKLKDREPDLELEISKRNMDIESLLMEIKSNEQKLENLRKEETSKASSNQELDEAESRIQHLKKECKGLEEEMKSKKTTIKQLQDEIMKIGGTDLQIQNSKVESMVQHIDIILNKQKRDKTAIKKAESDIKRLEKQEEELKKEVESNRSEIISTEEMLSQAGRQIEVTEQTLKNLADELEHSEDQLRSLEEQLELKSHENNDFQVLEVEINNQLEKLHDLQRQVERDDLSLHKQIDELKFRDVTSTLLKLDENVLPDEYKANNTTSDQEDNVIGGNCTPCKDSRTIEAYPPITDGASLLPTDGERSSCHGDNSMEIDTDAPASQFSTLSHEQLEGFDMQTIELEIGQLLDYIDNAKTDIEVLEEYAKSLANFRARKLDLNQAVSKREEISQSSENLKKKRLDEFMNGFNEISMTLKEMYQMITMGGNAELELVDSLDPFSEGVLFSVMPPKKSWRNISNLSGGEKTLSSLALVFALHRYRPTPLYVMDEIDAALDFRNVSIVANYIKERTRNAQFIVISLRNNMFELAKQLVGIYKNKNMTRSVALQNKDLIARD
ncbi:LADA_0F03422g1_1 [Lachancea dasiensis]|uniref:Structural maintenance of chromosomes protein n=1 Tax=Lachancea dasiensis TaxID=1072105 RepID=A0A1G4JIQ8_9SACH|nr:LADA_0F03422g1_1 [Lachancea dasiensis]